VAKAVKNRVAAGARAASALDSSAGGPRCRNSSSGEPLVPSEPSRHTSTARASAIAA